MPAELEQHHTNGDQPDGIETPPAPSSAAAFRQLRATPALLELPDSGMVVAVRRCHISDLAAEGVIPNHLAGVAMRVLGLPGAPPQPAALAESARESRGIIDAVCCAALVIPRMVSDDDQVDDDSIRVDDMPYRDREHVFAYVARLGEVRDLSRFPGGPASGLAPLADGGRVQGEAE